MVNKNIKYLGYTLIFTSLILLVLFNYKKIPNKEKHINRNKYNIMPVGKLTNINDNKYIDENGVIWLKRSFIQSILHNPFKNYIFETYSDDKNFVSSSEVESNKIDFDNGKQVFKLATYNYYSSVRYPISHFFSDMLPSIIYLFPDYKKY
jgi:hypothetical protein